MLRLLLTLALLLFPHLQLQDNSRRRLKSSSILSSAESCELQFPRQNLPLEVFWINLDISVDRRAFMTQQLSYYGLANNHRVRALVQDQLAVKYTKIDDEGCLSSGVRAPSSTPALSPSTTPVRSFHANKSSDAISKASHFVGSRSKKIIVQELCGRPRNTLRELVVTMSHINAINLAGISTAVAKRASLGPATSGGVDLSQYALILEDDLQLAFEVNFQALLDSAPKDFAVLQLVTSNDYSVLNLWRVFERHKQLFVRRKAHDDYWCAGAYIVHKARLFNLTRALLHSHPTAPGEFVARIVAGYDKPCHPARCCSTGSFVAQPPCVHASRGYAADNLMFSLSEDTYMLTVPIFLSSSVGNISTVHQRHVTFHQPAFHRMEQYTDRMARSPNPVLRSFINARCRFNYSQTSAHWLRGQLPL